MGKKVENLTILIDLRSVYPILFKLHQSKQAKRQFLRNKIKVLSVHWSKSPQILYAPFQAKLSKKTSLTKCLSICPSVCPRSFVSSGHKNGWRYSYQILYLDQMSSNLKSELYNILIPKGGFVGSLTEIIK